MPDDAARQAHLFATRTPDEIGRWARSLSWFRFCRAAPSPFVREADRLVVALAWSDPDDLLVLLGELEVHDPPASAPGAPVGVDRGPDGHLVPASGAGAWGRSGRQTLSGVRCEVVVRGDRLELVVSGEEQRRSEIVDRDVAAAVTLEREAVSRVSARVVDPPRDGPWCVSPARDPRLFRPDGPG